MDSLVDQQLGNYRLIRLLGQGGFANVYLGEHLHLGTHAAIKVLSMRLVGNNVEQFRVEARTIANLVHPHIVRILDFGLEDGIPFLVMDYAPGGTLRTRHPRGTRPPLPSMLSYVEQITKALQYAHDKKLVHRDVKPENMLLGRDDTLLLSDFGLVLTAQSSASRSVKEIAGTVPYMAPEQIQGKPCPASDQYALGIIVYEWLSGTPPFKGSALEMYGQHLHMPPPSLCEKVPTVPLAIEQVVMKALAKDPQQRFASVQAFAHALKRACQQMEQSASEHTLISPMPGNMQLSALATEAANQLMQPMVEDLAAGQSAISTYIKTPLGQSVQSPQPISSPSISLETPSTQSTQLAGAKPLPMQPPSRSLSQRQHTWTVPHITETRDAVEVPRRPVVSRPLAVVLVLLVGLLISGGVLYSLGIVSSAQRSGLLGGGAAMSRATITITPASKRLMKSYIFSAVTGTPDAKQNQVSARVLSIATQPQSQAVSATGKGTTPATSATGTLTFTNPYPHYSSYPASSVYKDANGIQVVTDAQADVPCCTPNSSVTVPAHVVQTGTVGNIPANDINQPAEPGNHPTFVNNSNAFTGGKNSQAYTAVSQSDIDGSASILENSLTPDAQTELQGQVRSSERLVDTPQCAPNVTSDHQVGDKVTSITVTVTITCIGEVYDHDGALSMATTLLRDQASKDLGSGYASVGTIKTTEAQATLIDTATRTIKVPVTAQGLWAFTFSDAQKLNLAKLIAGKKRDEAQSLLLSQPGIANVTIALFGDNKGLCPVDTSSISFVVQNVKEA